jgi:hypothetical protein
VQTEETHGLTRLRADEMVPLAAELVQLQKAHNDPPSGLMKLGSAGLPLRLYFSSFSQEGIYGNVTGADEAKGQRLRRCGKTEEGAAVEVRGNVADQNGRRGEGDVVAQVKFISKLFGIAA